MADTGYITKESALSCFHDWIDRYGHEHTADEMVEYQKIEELPAADVRPVVKAEWVECDWCVPSHGFVEHYKNAAWKCTNCKHAFKKQDLFVRNFCPNCGADMTPPSNGEK